MKINLLKSPRSETSYNTLGLGDQRKKALEGEGRDIYYEDYWDRL